MTREEILIEIKSILLEEFEIEDPEPDENLDEKYDFDSIDAIELIIAIEKMIGSPLTQNEKRQAMGIRNINQICDYVERMYQKKNPWTPIY